MLIWDIIYFVLGLILLYYGSDWFVLGAERLAKFFNVSNFVIGATVVAIGTSLPEIVTSIYAALTNSPGITVGNAIGSCVCNIGLILGVSAVISPILLNKELKKNITYYIILIVILTILSINGFDTIDGIILLILTLLYLKKTISDGKVEENNNNKDFSLPFSIIMLVIGLGAVLSGSQFLVEGAKGLAKAFGVPDFIIGFTLVAIGTSLPELMVSIISAKRKLGGLVLGNILGSNIIDVGFALGLPAVFYHLPSNYLGILSLFILSALIYIFSLKNKISRVDGAIILIIYLITIYFIFF
ncbi:calcium/sodium antiporter [Methanocaldococcus indicus]|uniref:calcium/sodium antiporter n=1 Tax=Methanocaldococcus indicus TaxID=213231 RepID=UPI003C6CC6D1